MFTDDEDSRSPSPTPEEGSVSGSPITTPPTREALVRLQEEAKKAYDEALPKFEEMSRNLHSYEELLVTVGKIKGDKSTLTDFEARLATARAEFDAKKAFFSDETKDKLDAAIKDIETNSEAIKKEIGSEVKSDKLELLVSSLGTVVADQQELVRQASVLQTTLQDQYAAASEKLAAFDRAAATPAVVISPALPTAATPVDTSTLPGVQKAITDYINGLDGADKEAKRKEVEDWLKVDPSAQLSYVFTKCPIGIRATVKSGIENINPANGEDTAKQLLASAKAAYEAKFPKTAAPVGHSSGSVAATASTVEDLIKSSGFQLRDAAMSYFSANQKSPATTDLKIDEIKKAILLEFAKHKAIQDKITADLTGKNPTEQAAYLQNVCKAMVRSKPSSTATLVSGGGATPVAVKLPPPPPLIVPPPLPRDKDIHQLIKDKYTADNIATSRSNFQDLSENGPGKGEIDNWQKYFVDTFFKDDKDSREKFEKDYAEQKTPETQADYLQSIGKTLVGLPPKAAIVRASSSTPTPVVVLPPGSSTSGSPTVITRLVKVADDSAGLTKSGSSVPSPGSPSGKGFTPGTTTHIPSPTLLTGASSVSPKLKHTASPAPVALDVKMKDVEKTIEVFKEKIADFSGKKLEASAAKIVNTNTKAFDVKTTETPPKTVADVQYGAGGINCELRAFDQSILPILKAAETCKYNPMEISNHAAPENAFAIYKLAKEHTALNIKPDKKTEELWLGDPKIKDEYLKLRSTDEPEPPTKKLKH